MEKQTAAAVYSEYSEGRAYKSSIDLFDTVKTNENMYNGKQWEGCNAPDIEKPVINVLHRVVSYFISMIVADDVSANFTPFQQTPENVEMGRIISGEVDKVIESSKLKELSRDVIRNSAVDGDGVLHLYFDPDVETGQVVAGQIEAEIIENTDIVYGNPTSGDIKKQPYIIVSLRVPTATVKEEAKAYGLSTSEIERIKPDEGDTAEGGTQSKLTTVLYKYFKKDREVWCVKTTPTVVLRPEWSTGYRIYPIITMPWEKVKNCCHGTAALTPYIPNQIAINQLFGMAIHSVKSNAFPKILFDQNKIKQWTNKVGEAIGVVGNPSENAIATPWRGADMSVQVAQLIDMVIQKTLEFMGASDTALGNIKPDNTSAIIATQKASSMPLELQKMAFYDLTEGYIRIIVDMMRVHYGTRMVNKTINGGEVQEPFDFSNLNSVHLSLAIDIGSAAYYSELMHIQTLDNLFNKGIIADAQMYLDSMPNQYIPNKSKIMEKLKEQSEMQAAAAQQVPQALPGLPQNIGGIK